MSEHIKAPDRNKTIHCWTSDSPTATASRETSDNGEGKRRFDDPLKVKRDRRDESLRIQIPTARPYRLKHVSRVRAHKIDRTTRVLVRLMCVRATRVERRWTRRAEAEASAPWMHVQLQQQVHPRCTCNCGNKYIVDALATTETSASWMHSQS
jgi:hypothetical protein